MGLKTIQAIHTEARKDVESTIGSFLKDARGINSLVGQYEKKMNEISKASEEVGNLVMKAYNGAKGLNTHGIVQLDEVKKLLVLATEHPHNPHAVNLGELEKLERTALSEIEKSLQEALRQRVEKLTSTWPSEIKVGMVFKNGDRMIEISSAQMKATNVNLKGDEALYYKAKIVKDLAYGSELTYNLAELNPKKGWEFLKT
jgi:hypothetical protein